MTAIHIPPLCFRRLQPQSFVRNGMLVSAWHQQNMADLVNQIARYRGKEFGAFGGDVTASTTSKTWRGAGHIGPMTSAIVARVFMGLANQVTATNNPRVQLALYDSSGAAITSGSAFFGTNHGNTPNKTPDEFGTATIALSIPAAYRDTSFRYQLAASEEAHAISCTIYELALAPDTDNGYVNNVYPVNSPILDTDRSSIQTLAHSLYKRGGPTLFAYSSETDATAPAWSASFTGGYVNVLDGFGVAGGWQRPGFRINQQFCNRKTLTTIPAKFELYAKNSASNGVVRVVDELGNIYASWNTMTTSAAWQTAVTADIPADHRMYMLETIGNGGSTTTIYALSAFRYQS